MDTGNIHDLTAAYALDALSADEREAFEAHLAQCEECRAALSALSDTAASLAWSVDAPPPPARLRASILGAAAAERTNVVPLPVRRSAAFRATAAIATVAACAAVALGVWAATMTGAHSCPGGWQCTALSGGRGLVALKSGRGVLLLDGLPSAPAGKTYQAWVIPKGEPARPAGLFAGGNATTVVQLAQAIPRGATVAATLERSGGASAPTTAPVFSARV